jgi:hypothetical protein
MSGHKDKQDQPGEGHQDFLANGGVEKRAEEIHRAVGVQKPN